MKNILFILIAIVAISCGTPASNAAYVDEDDSRSRFVTIDDFSGHSFDVIYDKETRVMYTVSTGTYNCGNVTVLLDSTGKPLTYKPNHK